MITAEDAEERRATDANQVSGQIVDKTSARLCVP